MPSIPSAKIVQKRRPLLSTWNIWMLMSKNPNPNPKYLNSTMHYFERKDYYLKSDFCKSACSLYYWLVSCPNFSTLIKSLQTSELTIHVHLYDIRSINVRSLLRWLAKNNKTCKTVFFSNKYTPSDIIAHVKTFHFNY